MKRPYQKFLFFMCDRPAVDDTCLLYTSDAADD